MKMVRILEAFTGYPNGKRRDFTKGQKLEVSDEFAELITSPEKRHAEEIDPPAPAPAKKETA